ncbi:MAG: 2-oxoacid:acceptor oxidoreductase family protein [Clostridia bacterium]|nr:2-oxoacid:acceptor oxidoreductase family protein [Clostridia bacterium]
MKEIVFAGFGGQGVLTGGLILAYMAAQKDLNATWVPSYGAEMRGGAAKCVVKFGESKDEMIGSPSMEEADIIFLMNKPSMTYLKDCKPNATVFVNSHAIEDTSAIPSTMKVIKINCVEKAMEVKNPKGANLIMCAAAIKECKLFDLDYAMDTMCKFFEDKGKGKFNEANRRAFQAGYDAV